MDSPTIVSALATLILSACPPTSESPAASPHSHSAKGEREEDLTGARPVPHAALVTAPRGPKVVPSFWLRGGPILLASDMDSIDNPIGPTPGAPEALKFELERLVDPPGSLRNVLKRLQDRRRCRLRKLV